MLHRAAGRVGHGFAEVIVERGVAARSLGAVAEVRAADDAVLGDALAAALIGGARTPADLAVAQPELELYRIAGDPFAPFVGARGSRAALQGASATRATRSPGPVEHRQIG